MLANSLSRIRQAILQRGLAAHALLAIALAICGMGCSDGRPTPASAPLPVAVVAVGDITQVVRAAGVVQPRLKVDLGAQVSGQVQQLHVQLGQPVKAGELLVSLDSQAGRNAVQLAGAALKQEVASMRRTRIELDGVRLEAERQRRLLNGNATSAVELEQADLALAKLETDLQGREAAVDQRRADLADKELKLTYARVSAPIDAEVVSIAVQEGQSVNAVQLTPTLLTLAQLKTMTVKARVAEADIGLVRAGQKARFTTLSAKARRYESIVRVIQPIPERVGNALFYNVLFEVDNADRALLSDMTVQVELDVAQASRVPVVPTVVLEQIDSDGRYIVNVLDASGRTAPRRIRLGVHNERHAQVLEGLKPGDRVQWAAAVNPTTSPAQLSPRR